MTGQRIDMQRDEMISRLQTTEQWDIAVIGGGAVGMGVALDAASRGYSCVLFDQHDFAKGTSSRSTKLIHGGVRYLAQGNVSLVREALRERGLLLRNAPDFVKPLRFIIPCYSMTERWYYWAGLKCYDGLAGRLGIENSRQLNSAELNKAVPGLRPDGLNGGVAYFDAQFDDANLVIAAAQKTAELGGCPLNYFRVEDLLKSSNNQVEGLVARNQETDQSYEVRAKAVVNAAGVFSDEVRRLENNAAPRMIAPSQGIHIVVDLKFLGGEDAIMIPKTKDGRVLFGIPWLGRAVLGTTDTPLPKATLEPRALEEEVSYLLEHFAQYFSPAPTSKDVLSCFAGLRPLVKPKQEAGATSKISREHRVVRSRGQLISILGGKWTTFRKMAEDVIESAIEVGNLTPRKVQTENLQLHSATDSLLNPQNPPANQEVVAFVRDGFARTVEDILARRSRSLLLNAKESIQSAERVAQVVAAELGHDQNWVEREIESYTQLANGYLIGENT